MPSVSDRLKHAIIGAHKLAQRIGVDIVPSNYYSPVVKLPDLERTRSVWAQKSEMPGLRIDLDAQVQAMASLCAPFRDEYAGNTAFREAVEHHFGPGYGYIEAQALHGVIRALKPGRIVEVGSGVSTFCMHKALERNGAGKITSIEPYPSAALRALDSVELIASPVQEVGLAPFISLGPGDFLFIDSSHIVKPGSDVNFLYLEVLPRLPPGVTIHIHDIAFPFDYQPDTLQTLYHWSEPALVRAYLAFNEKVDILFCMSQLHYERPEALKEVFPEYQPAPHRDGLMEGRRVFRDSPGHFPASLYLQTK
ncbi:MAG: hypothetical protein GEU75_02360 [Dehalococcoidia bacterium]|nr:hypothetical protein [Dehalococcoidia bacterium]